MLIKNLSLIFGSKTKAQEMVLLMNDAKSVVRQGFYEQKLPKIEKFCYENQLFMVKSRFKVLLADETAYSNKGLRLPEKDKRPGMYFVYLSKDEEKALLASYYELVGNDAGLGEVLGYPPCCVSFFCREFSQNNPDLQLKPTNPYTNLTQREKDCVVISHFPCSSECPESFRLAQRFLAVLEKQDRERAREMMGVLGEGLS